MKVVIDSAKHYNVLFYKKDFDLFFKYNIGNVATIESIEVFTDIENVLKFIEHIYNKYSHGVILSYSNNECVFTIYDDFVE